MTRNDTTTTTLSRLVVVAICAIVLGGALAIIAIGLEWRGFAGGLAQGAGIGLAGVGCYMWGFLNGLRKTVHRAAWLPSRDGHS